MPDTFMPPSAATTGIAAPDTVVPDPAGSPMVELSNVRLTLAGGAGPVNVLRQVDLRLPKGVSASVTGPSGSGKTSLLMAIAGLERISSGRAVVAGKDITTMGEDALASFRLATMGIVFQAFHLMPAMTALENTALPLELAGRTDARATAARWLDAVGLSERYGHFPSELSGGEQQRVALARAFAPEPQLILADEPTGNLDEDTGAQVMELLFDLHRQRGTTLLLVTHNPQLAARCEINLRMHGGILQSGAAAEGSA